MKKTIKALIVLLIVSILGCSFGCDGGNSSSNQAQSVPSSQQQSSLQEQSSSQDIWFNVEVWNYRVYVGDSRKIIVQASGLNEPIYFTSSDPNIVEFSDEYYDRNTIYAKKAGEVTITISYGNLVDYVRVISTFGDLKPELKFQNDVRDVNKLVVDERLDINFNVLFNQKLFEASSANYEITKDGVKITEEDAVVENGVFTAKKAGIYTVKVTATWSNYVGDGLVTLLTMKVQ